MNYSEIVSLLQQCNRQKTSSAKEGNLKSLQNIQSIDMIMKDACRQTLDIVLDAIWQGVCENNQNIIQSLAIDRDTIFPQSYQGYNHSGSTSYIQADGLLVDCLTLYGLDDVKAVIVSLYESLDDLHSSILSQEDYDIFIIKDKIENIRIMIAH
ncbi:MAG: hypothetical protein ACO3UU_06395 [Minisyncoccia bacterium]|jgi:hypothetical protein